MAMRPPSTFGNTPLMMRREVAPLSHKPKRVLLCHPGKPLLRLWLKREQAVLRTDHHIVPLIAILHARDDMNRLGRRFGCGRGSGTRARSRACGLGWTLGHAAGLSLRQRDGGYWLVLPHEAGEISHLLLERGDLGLQGGELCRQGQE